MQVTPQPFTYGSQQLLKQSASIAVECYSVLFQLFLITLMSFIFLIYVLFFL